MDALHVHGQELKDIGFPEGKVIGAAIDLLRKAFGKDEKEQAFDALRMVLNDPETYKGDEVFGPVARLLLPGAGMAATLRNEPVAYSVFGAEFIHDDAIQQMDLAARLPVSVAGAVMPDAHHGYGLPIGGVLATENAIIPYGVGVDIGCRMALSIFDILPEDLTEREKYYTRELNEATLFGTGGEYNTPGEHEVLERAEFRETELLRSLHERASHQLGTSGSGNHFVEFGIVDIKEYDKKLGVKPGRYVGLLSHSGSRGLGAAIANHYTRLAREKRQLDRDAAHLSWFYLDEPEGQEYWRAMNLAGDYASANHEVIHRKIARQLGREPIGKVENHHNFAWKEEWQGREVIVHRKGATPAGKGVLGIIPGSMTAPGFIVRGRGEERSLNSASHGAGRQMSRTEARRSVTPKQLAEELVKHGVKLLSAGLDEAPFAYKDINAVMAAQTDLVDIVGTFKPRIVKMADEKIRGRRKKRKG